MLTGGSENKFLMYKKILGNKTTVEISYWVKTPTAFTNDFGNDFLDTL